MNAHCTTSLLVGLVISAAGQFAAAQTARLAENFDNVGTAGASGPTNLVASGWIFRNQSQPLGVGPLHWFERHGDTHTWGDYPPYQGTAYIETKQSASVATNGQASNWMILPPIPGMQPGDAIEFWFRGFPNVPSDRLEVRLSPTGGTSTGSTASSVGDFTTLLLSEDALLDVEPFVMDEQWYLTTVPLPTTGRIAFRYYSPSAVVGGSGGVWAVDALRVTAGTPAEPPYPSVG
jgi:hypothetical protein